MSAPSFRLSKSKIAAYEHCPRRLWLQVHRRHEASFDAATLARFRFGHDVGAKAVLLTPGGVMVDTGMDMKAALARTAKLLAQAPARPIFEATFQHQDVLVRVDILEPDGIGGWRAIEVKASTRVKAYQLADIATQVWVMRGCGLYVREAHIRHLKPPFSWHRPDILAVQFTDTNVTRRIARYLRTRGAIAYQAKRAIGGPEVRRETGPHCERPFSCEFQRFCKCAEALPLFASSSD